MVAEVDTEADPECEAAANADADADAGAGAGAGAEVNVHISAYAKANVDIDADTETQGEVDARVVGDADACSVPEHSDGDAGAESGVEISCSDIFHSPGLVVWCTTGGNSVPVALLVIPRPKASV